MIYELKIPDLPPSMNSKTSGYKANHFAVARAKKAWEGQIMVALLQAKVPKGLSAVTATATLHVPDRRRRDEGNYRMMLEKALGDILTQHEYIPDDTPEHFSFERLMFVYEKGVRLTKVKLQLRG